MLRAMPIRDATPQDCPAIWPFLHRIVANAGFMVPTTLDAASAGRSAST
jgi:hypothetical protein